MKLTDLDAYEVLEQCPLRDLKSEGLVLRHKKSGARIAVISNDDDNKVFYIGFCTGRRIHRCTIYYRTQYCAVRINTRSRIRLGTGWRILKYIFKCDHLSGENDLSAASCNDTDFQNLMSVYMDAVFIRIFI